MLDKVYQSTLRLHPDNSLHAKAYDYITNRDKAKGATISNYIAACILAAEEGALAPNNDLMKELIKESLREYDQEKQSQSYL